MNELISEAQKCEWRETYKGNRYLAQLQPSKLENRLEDILLNLLDFSDEGKPYFDQTVKMDGLVEKFIHVDEEMNQRGFPRSLIKNPEYFIENYPNISSAIKAWDSRKFEEGEYLIKFGNKEHLFQMKNFGNIRINPASYYKDSSLNKAVHDDELSRITMLPKGTKLKRQMPNGEYEEIKGIQNLSISNKYSTDFYVYCMSTIYQHRLFDDFNTNACLLIFNPRTFLDKLLKILKKHYSDWKLESGNVKYYDPFFPKSPLDIPLNKHFRYWYQSEYRIAFKSKNPIEKLEHIDLEIGSLQDCSELIHF